jgi:hypothetical protein
LNAALKKGVATKSLIKIKGSYKLAIKDKAKKVKKAKKAKKAGAKKTKKVGAKPKKAGAKVRAIWLHLLADNGT